MRATGCREKGVLDAIHLGVVIYRYIYEKLVYPGPSEWFLLTETDSNRVQPTPTRHQNTSYELKPGMFAKSAQVTWTPSLGLHFIPDSDEKLTLL